MARGVQTITNRPARFGRAVGLRRVLDILGPDSCANDSHMKRHSVITLVVLVGLGYMAALSSVAAEEVENTPIYNSETKSYFEYIPYTLVRCHCTWVEAYRAAQRLEYKGVRGRLAVIKSVDVHEFLMHKFQPKDFTWIGLRYLCPTRELQWVTGDLMTPGSFSAWNVPWNLTGSWACAKDYNKAQILGVAYLPIANGFRWGAREAHKYYGHLFVEFPTGQP